MENTFPLPQDLRPRLRNHLEAQRKGEEFVIQDSRRIGRTIGVTRLGLEIMTRLDGTRTVQDIQSELMPFTGGAIVPMNVIESLVQALDTAYLLNSPRLKALFDEPVRPSNHMPPGISQKQLGDDIEKLFTATGGPGMPARLSGQPEKGRLRAVLLPHMDYGRGNVTYGHGFKELLENNYSTLFVIIATSHYSHARFTLSRQHFGTPFGTVETDVKYVDRIAELYGPGVYDDPEAHVPEHSIELEVVPLKYLMGDRPFRIVPLLVGSFHDCVDAKTDPTGKADLARMVQVLREVEAKAGETVCYVISGDLAHIGPKFRDKRKAAGPWLEESRAKDHEILKTLEKADPAAYFNVIADEGDSRRICGLPPTWLTLEVARPTTGKILHYQQYIHPTGYESVSFAAASFYGS